MNQHVTLTYEQQARANAKAVRDRLYGKPKVVNVIKDILAQKAEEARQKGKILDTEPDEHIKAYYLWHQCAFKRTTMNDYAETLCQQKGTDLEAVRSMRRARALTVVLDFIAFEMKAMFPHKPLSEIGRVLNREHSSIVRSLEREALRRGLKPIEVKSTDYPELETFLREGKTLTEISAVYEVGISVISRRMHTMGISHLLQTKSKPVSLEFIESVRVEYVEGHSLASISTKYGISVRSIVNWKNAFGWPERRPRKARAA